MEAIPSNFESLSRRHQLGLVKRVANIINPQNWYLVAHLLKEISSIDDEVIEYYRHFDIPGFRIFIVIHYPHLRKQLSLIPGDKKIDYRFLRSFFQKPEKIKKLYVDGKPFQIGSIFDPSQKMTDENGDFRYFDLSVAKKLSQLGVQYHSRDVIELIRDALINLDGATATELLYQPPETFYYQLLQRLYDGSYIYTQSERDLWVSLIVPMRILKDFISKMINLTVANDRFLMYQKMSKLFQLETKPIVQRRLEPITIDAISLDEIDGEYVCCQNPFVAHCFNVVSFLKYLQHSGSWKCPVDKTYLISPQRFRG